MRTKVILSAVLAGIMLAGCGSDNNASIANDSNTTVGDNNTTVADNNNTTVVSYLDKIASTGVALPYSVLDATIDNPEKPGEKLEVRNGGYGSSAAAHPTNINQFYSMTDRGANIDFGKDGKIFVTPAFTPRIGLFEIQSDGTVKKVKDILFKDTADNNISGLPNSAAFGGTGEIAYDNNGNILDPDDFGLDPEGLAALKDGTFWVSDEYGPHIVHFDANGKEIERINAFANDTRSKCKLPAEFAKRRPNRGMEGIAITPDQKTLVGIMQSTMDNPKAVRKSDITRIVSVDLETCKSKQYLYRQVKTQNANSAIVALSNDTFIIIERDGKLFKGGSEGAADPLAQKHVYKIKLSTGTELESLALTNGMEQNETVGLTIDGDTLEEVVFDVNRSWNALASKGIKPVEKSLVVDMVKEVGYPHDKMEGLIVFNNSTLGVLNDDDFAVVSIDDVLEQKYINEANTTIDGNILYVIKDLNLTAN